MLHRLLLGHDKNLQLHRHQHQQQQQKLKLHQQAQPTHMFLALYTLVVQVVCQTTFDFEIQLVERHSC
jgi:hypothetical protein